MHTVSLQKGKYSTCISKVNDTCIMASMLLHALGVVQLLPTGMPKAMPVKKDKKNKLINEHAFCKHKISSLVKRTKQQHSILNHIPTYLAHDNHDAKKLGQEGTAAHEGTAAWFRLVRFVCNIGGRSINKQLHKL